MKPNLLRITVLFFLVFLITTCNHDSKSDLLSVSTLNGKVQKGPFLNGTTVTIKELDPNFNQTGKTYSTNLVNNNGSFSISNLSLITPYIELTANGYYFNENTGQNSVAPLTLNAIVDVSNKTSLNINVLTSLEFYRVHYLLSNGLPFTEAKHQAQEEILNLFECSQTDMNSSELLDISELGDGNAALLAISSILQGALTESQLSELLANISSDLQEDGLLNNEALGTTLINNATYIDAQNVRNNLSLKYDQMSINVNVPDFSNILNHFITSTGYKLTEKLSYPESGATGPNVLSTDRTVYIGKPYGISGYYNSMTAIAPGQTDISVKLTFIDTCDQVPPPCDSCLSPCVPCGQSTTCGWGIDPINSGWDVNNVPGSLTTFIITKDFTKDTLDFKFALTGHGKALIEIFENKSSVADRTKIITW